jgi:hypothetical protein
MIIISTATRVYHDLELRVSHGLLHGMPVVHEVRIPKRGQLRSTYYVEASCVAKLKRPLQKRVAHCVYTDLAQFDVAVKALAQDLKLC